VKNAYECKEEYSPNGKCLKRERAIGPIVPWAVVVVLAILAGYSLPAAFWQMVKLW